VTEKKPTYKIDLYSAGFGRWHYSVLWSDGAFARSTRPIWRYWCALVEAGKYAQEARRG
jgi:hypothetical protein